MKVQNVKKMLHFLIKCINLIPYVVDFALQLVVFIFMCENCAKKMNNLKSLIREVREMLEDLKRKERKSLKICVRKWK